MAAAVASALHGPAANGHSASGGSSCNGIGNGIGNGECNSSASRPSATRAKALACGVASGMAAASAAAAAAKGRLALHLPLPHGRNASELGSSEHASPVRGSSSASALGEQGVAEDPAQLERRRVVAEEAKVRLEEARLLKLSTLEERVASLAAWQADDKTGNTADKRMRAQLASRLGLLEERLLTAEAAGVALRRENEALLGRLRTAQAAGFLGQ